MKDQILSLRKEGKTYNEIVQILGCSKSSVSYYCSPEVREGYRTRRRENRKKHIVKLKHDAGGKCKVCGYNRCLTSLGFHHTNPKTKVGGVCEMVYTHGIRAAIEESKKCVLVCANCHGEIHDGIIEI